MVDFIITDFESVRGGGNIVDTVPSIEDFIVGNCTISSSSGEFVLTPGASLVDSVSLSVSPLSVTVGGSVVLTATVLDDEDDPLEDISVSFRAGSSVIGSDTTDSNGEASYTTTMGSVGTFSMTAVAGGVTSTAQSVTVNKITSTISLSAVSSTITVGDTPQLTGTLSVGSGESVKIYRGDVLVDTVTTGTDGAFSFTGSATSTSGSLIFKAVYDGDSTHSSVTSSNVVITVTGSTPVMDSISLTEASSKTILSAYDSDTASLTATVLDSDSSGMSGVTVTFKKNGTSIGTATTNSIGVATKSYSADGSGDISFTAECSDGSSTFVSEIYSLEDCTFYSPDGTKLSGSYSTASDSSYSYITGCQSNVAIPNTVSIPSNFEFNYKYYCATPQNPWSSFNSLWNVGSDTNNGVLIGCEADDHRIRIYNRSGGSNTIQQTQTNAFQFNEWVDVKIKYKNGLCSITLGSYTISYSKSFTTSFIKLYANYTNTRLTDFKLKPL